MVPSPLFAQAIEATIGKLRRFPPLHQDLARPPLTALAGGMLNCRKTCDRAPEEACRELEIKERAFWLAGIIARTQQQIVNRIRSTIRTRVCTRLD